jgi:hypothetical protein
MIPLTPGRVPTRPALRAALRYHAASWDNDILTFHADSLPRDALTGPGIHQRQAADT